MAEAAFSSVRSEYSGASFIDTFRSAMRITSWHVQRCDGDAAPLTLATSSASGLTASRISLMPHTSENRPGKDDETHRYVAYSCNRAHYLQLEEGRKIKVSPDEIFILDSRTTVTDSYPIPYVSCSLVFDADLFEDMVSAPHLITGRGLGRDDPICGLLEGIMQCAVANVVNGRFVETAPGFSHAFLAMLNLKASGERSVPTRHAWSRDERCAQIKNHIDQNFHLPDFSIADMSKQLGVSPRYVCKIFSINGKGPAEYLKQVRLETAACMLGNETERNQTITDIAYLCGFSESSNFSREFKRHFDVTPREFRAYPSRARKS